MLNLIMKFYGQNTFVESEIGFDQINEIHKNSCKLSQVSNDQRSNKHTIHPLVKDLYLSGDEGGLRNKTYL